MFLAALALTSDSERAEYVETACGKDKALRDNVKRLLLLHNQTDRLIDAAVIFPVDPAGQESIDASGTRIGPYRIQNLIGEGGFGVVYLASQEKPLKRQVALKVVKPGMDTRQILARFDAERQALAMMDHRNIARVYDVGATEAGRPYFAMELVDGVSITEYCDENRLSIVDRLKLFVQVCEGIQHAHQKGVIHRDIKPSNILISRQDGRCEPKVIDFGVAKALNQRLTELSMATTGLFMLGTPLYMSPEQADTGSIDVDTRSDIYSLGALLYEMLTGTTPLDRNRVKNATYEDLRRMIRDEEPPRPSSRVGLSEKSSTAAAENRQLTPSRLRSLLNRDLDWIVMKAIARERERRYESVGRLADDIKRYLDGDSVAARPPSIMYKMQKLVLRHRTALIAAVILLLATTVGLAVSTALILEQRNIARREAEQAELARLEALQEKRVAIENVYYANIQVAYQDWRAGQVRRMHRLLDDLRPGDGERDLRGWEWYYLHSLCHMDERTIQTRAGAVSSIAQSPDGTQIASGSASDNTVRIWDASTGEELACLRGHRSTVSSVAWSSDGRRLASGAWDGTLLIWDLESLGIVHEVSCGTMIMAVAWRPDGEVVAAGGHRQVEGNSEDGVVWIVDGNSGEQVGELCGNVGIVRSLAWHPTGTYLAAGENWQGFIQVWEPGTLRLVKSFDAHNHYIGALAWSPDGRWLASGSQSDAIRVFDTSDWSLANEIPRSHKGRVNAVCWNDAGNRLASFGLDGVVKLWDIETTSVVATLRGHQGAVTSGSWSRNQEMLVTASSDSTIKVWNLNKQEETRVFTGTKSVAWSPNGKELAIRAMDAASGVESVQVVNAGDGTVLNSLQLDGTGFVGALDFSPDGAKLAVGKYRPGRLIVWDLANRQVILDSLAHGFELRSVDWSPDGSRLVTGGKDGLIQVWDMQRRKSIQIIQARSAGGNDVDCVVWNPPGTRFASSTQFSGVTIWDAETYAPTHTLNPPKFESGGQYPLAWNSTGDRLAISCSGGEIVVVDAATGSPIYTAVGNTSFVRSVAWSPDGTRLASGGYDRQLKIWDASSGRELFSFSGIDESIECVVWSPDGRQIALANSSNIEVLDATRGYAADSDTESAQ